MKLWYILYIITHEYKCSFYILFWSSDCCSLLNAYSHVNFIQYLSPCARMISPMFIFFKGNRTIFLLWWKCWSTNISSRYLMTRLWSFLSVFYLFIWYRLLIIRICKETIIICFINFNMVSLLHRLKLNVLSNVLCISLVSTFIWLVFKLVFIQINNNDINLNFLPDNIFIYE